MHYKCMFDFTKKAVGHAELSNFGKSGVYNTKDKKTACKNCTLVQKVVSQGDMVNEIDTAIHLYCI